MEYKVCPDCESKMPKESPHCTVCGHEFINGNNITYIKTNGNNVIYTKDNESKSNNDSNQTYIILAIACFIIFVICWFYEASHGVALSQAEIDYIGAHYAGPTFVMGRICMIVKPISIIMGVVFSVIAISKKGK